MLCFVAVILISGIERVPSALPRALKAEFAVVWGKGADRTTSLDS
ncbi:MAG TPA: hypothetical protein VKO43_03020 [Candidatus Krumholzibacteriaceae bacterium]|nr:hypothetical protein [Candidatus Krumholzibacteriaceae bacterium]